MRAFYTLLLYLSFPWVLTRLWWRGYRLPDYRRHWRERLGYVPQRADSGVLWLHAVSVGEVRAVEPLVEALRARWPQRPLLLTTSTPTGRATVERLWSGEVECRYLPWDLPGAVGRFLERTRPAAALVVETEWWPNLFHALAERRIPLYLVNARLSPSSLAGWLRFRRLAATTLGGVTAIAAQTSGDAEAFVRLGAPRERVHSVGQLKFEARLPAAFEQRVAGVRQQLGGRRPIWVAGSTHAGEEEAVLGAHRRLLASFPEALLLLAPRHPERATEVLRLCEREGWSCRRLSGSQSGDGDVQVVVVDLLGELVYLYGAAQAAFLGGSLVQRGGHNPLEAVLAGTPVLSGPSVANFADVYERLFTAGAARLVEDEQALAGRLGEWFSNEAARRQAAEAGLEVIEHNRGALQRTLDILSLEDGR